MAWEGTVIFRLFSPKLRLKARHGMERYCNISTFFFLNATEMYCESRSTRLVASAPRVPTPPSVPGGKRPSSSGFPNYVVIGKALFCVFFYLPLRKTGLVCDSHNRWCTLSPPSLQCLDPLSSHHLHGVWKIIDTTIFS